MIEKIKKKVSETYDLNEKKGFFLTGIDNNNNILFSNGVIYTDKTLSKVIDDLYHGIAEKKSSNIKVLIVDVVKDIEEVNDSKKILETSVKEKGMYLMTQDGQKSGVMLPDMEGIADAKNALYAIKQKYNIQGNVKVYTFTTKRDVITI